MDSNLSIDRACLVNVHPLALSTCHNTHQEYQIEDGCAALLQSPCKCNWWNFSWVNLIYFGILQVVNPLRESLIKLEFGDDLTHEVYPGTQKFHQKAVIHKRKAIIIGSVRGMKRSMKKLNLQPFDFTKEEKTEIKRLIRGFNEHQDQGENTHASVDADDADDADKGHDDIVWKPKLNKPDDYDEIKTRINDLEFKSDVFGGSSYEINKDQFETDLKIGRYWLYTNSPEYQQQYEEAKQSYSEKVDNLIFLIEEANYGMQTTIAANETVNQG